MEEDAELETAPEAGVTGIAVARDRQGLYVAKAPKSLRVHQGDRLLGARVFFEGAPPEEVARVLEGAKSCKVSLCLRRRTPPTRGPPLGGTDSEGHRGKVARLSIPILTPSKKPPPAAGAVSAALPGAVAVELALPKLVKSRGVAEPAPTATATEPRRPRAPPSRLTVKEAAAGKIPVMEEPAVKAEVPGVAAQVPVGPGARIPAVEVAAPKISLGLSLGGAAPPVAPQTKEGPTLRLPRVEVVVPALPVPPESGTTPARPQTKPPGEVGAGDGKLPKPKPPHFGTVPGEDEEGETGTRGGLAGFRVPSIAIAVPSAALELVPELGVPKAVAGEQPRLEAKPPRPGRESPPAAPAGLTFPAAAGVPSIDIAVPRVEVGLALPAGAPVEGDAGAMPEVTAKFAKGLRKLSLELEAVPGVEIIVPPAQLTGEAPAPVAKTKPPKFTFPRFGLSLAKLRPGGEGNEHPPASRGPAPPVGSPAVASDLAPGTSGAAGGVKLKVPKLSLAPFGAKDGDKDAGGEDAGPRDAGRATKLPWLGIGGPGGAGGRSVEPGSPGTSRLRVPQVGIALPATGNRRVPSLPKLPTEPEPSKGVTLPKFGGSSPDIRTGGDPKTMRRGESAESLSAGRVGRKIAESPGTIRSKLKTKGVRGDGGAQPLTPRFTVPEVGFTMPVTQTEDPLSRKMPKTAGVLALKVPALELAPPGMDGKEEPTGKEETTGKERAAPGNRSRLKLPKFSTGSGGNGSEGEGRMRMGSVKKAVLVLVKPKEKGEDGRVVDPRPHLNGETEGKAQRGWWVPKVGFSPGGSPPEPPVTQPKGGRMQLPDVELCPGTPQFNQQQEMREITPCFKLGGLGGEGTPKFQLPKLELSPQPCGEQ